MNRTAFVDEMAAAAAFGGGDVVRKTSVRDFVLSPYVGRVLYSSPKTGKVMVQWPWGAEQESPVELVKDLSGDFESPMGDQSYHTWEGSVAGGGHPDEDDPDVAWKRVLATSTAISSRIAMRRLMSSRIVQEHERRTLPVWRTACKCWHSGQDEVKAYMAVASAHSAEFGDESARLTVSNLYELGRRLSVYWRDKQRKYRVTQREKSSGKIECARCHGIMKPRTYTHGQRVLMCKTCGFTVHPGDLN